MENTKPITNYINDGFIIKNNDGEDEIMHIPYNLNNILISEMDIIQILAKYNVNIDKINHIEYFRQAFTHKSYCKKDNQPQHILDAAKLELGNPSELLELMDKCYDRIEYFGDRVLKLIVSMYLFHRYPKQDEGFMTRLQTKLEDKKNLAIMSKEIGLNKFFIISKQIEMMNGRNLDKIHEDVFESFIGALFLSNGFEPCMFLIINLLETLIDYSEKLYCDNNYKDQLLRVHHQKQWKFPQYITIHFEGPHHKRKYIMGVERHDVEPDCPIEKRCISFGVGSSKKEGEQVAAKMALIIHGILKKDQYSQSDIYYPPWDKIFKFDGETMIINQDFKDTIISENSTQHMELVNNNHVEILTKNIETNNELTKKTVNKKTDELIEETVDKKTNESIEEIVKKPTKKTVNKTVEKPTKKTVDKKTNESIEEIVKKPTKKTVNKKTDESIEEIVEKPTKKTVEKPTKKTVNKTVEKPINKTVEKPTKKTVNKTVNKKTKQKADKINNEQIDDIDGGNFSDKSV
jgi:ribonuclease-3